MNWLRRFWNFRQLKTQGRLIWRLVRDPRTPTHLKALPALAAAYAVFPFDFLPMLPFDDITLMVGVASAFLYLAPDHLIDEHRIALGMADGTA